MFLRLYLARRFFYGQLGDGRTEPTPSSYIRWVLLVSLGLSVFFSCCYETQPVLMKLDENGV